MTIYGKGCISNYRNCSLSYVWYSVLYRMLTFHPFHQFEVRIWSHNLSVSNFGGGGPAYRTFVVQVVGV